MAIRLNFRLADHHRLSGQRWPSADRSLPELVFAEAERPVVQVIEEATGEILYTVRANSNRFKPPVYSPGTYQVKVGIAKPNLKSIAGLTPLKPGDIGGIENQFGLIFR